MKGFATGGPIEGGPVFLRARPTAGSCKDCDWAYTSATWCTRYLDFIAREHQQSTGHTVVRTSV